MKLIQSFTSESNSVSRAASVDCRFGRDLFLLNLAHDVHNAFVNTEEIAIGQRPRIDSANIVEYCALAIWLVDRHPDVAFQLANLVGCLRPLAKQFHQSAVKLVNFLAPVGNVHR